VKTAISIPDSVFDEATRRAMALGISRSEFFAIAARRYLDALERESLTARIDQALDDVADDDSSDAAVAAGRSRLVSEADW
jgi:metal-responsive CopG/Arc/MetJ family transcriptional regulator